MKRVLLSLLLVVTGCDSSLPTTSAPSLPLPVELNICYSALHVDFTWKLDEVITETNSKFKKFKIVPTEDFTCLYEIEFEVKTLQVNSFGLTTQNFTVLNEYTPSIWRKHAICHELGHALMLDHSNRQTCMNPESEHEQLDDMDLRDIEARLAYLIG